MRVAALVKETPLLMILASCCWWVLLSIMWFGSCGDSCVISGTAVAFTIRPTIGTTINIPLLAP